jgi:G6PDH family F420-dependent oxidoreductase
VLGAVAQVTEQVELFTYVTCPTMRYHPAVVAQKAATLQILADGRFTLGVGSGENLNEHVVGGRWPTVSRRQEMLKEAVQIIRELFTGELIDWKGEYFEVDSARIWDVPETPVAIATAVSGERSVDMFAPLSDHLIAVEPNKVLVDAWHDARRATGLPGEVRVIGQIPICWDPDRDAAVQRAHDQFRWFGGGWAVNADLPTTAGFEGATQFVRPEDVADSIPCGPDLDAIVDAVRKYWEAGFTDIALVQSATTAKTCSSRKQPAHFWKSSAPNPTERNQLCRAEKGSMTTKMSRRAGVRGRRMRAAKAAWRHERTRLMSTRRARSRRPDRCWASRPSRLRR